MDSGLDSGTYGHACLLELISPAPLIAICLHRPMVTARTSVSPTAVSLHPHSWARGLEVSVRAAPSAPLMLPCDPPGAASVLRAAVLRRILPAQRVWVAVACCPWESSLRSPGNSRRWWSEPGWALLRPAKKVRIQARLGLVPLTGTQVRTVPSGASVSDWRTGILTALSVWRVMRPRPAPGAPQPPPPADGPPEDEYQGTCAGLPGLWELAEAQPLGP